MTTAATILASNGRVPLIIDGGATLLQAAQRMTMQKIGSLLILGPNEKLAGIFTERDFMRVTSRLGSAALSALVRTHMTHEVVTCEPSTSIDNIEFDMNTKKFRHMPVVEGGRVIGVISAGDIIKWRHDMVMRNADTARRRAVSA